MSDNTLQQAAIALQQDWGMRISDNLTEEEILKLLAERVALLVDQGPEPFYRAMYRIDVSEKKLNAILHEKDVADKIARLIYDRQIQKIKSREMNKGQRTEDEDPEMRW